MGMNQTASRLVAATIPVQTCMVARKPRPSSRARMMKGQAEPVMFLLERTMP